MAASARILVVDDQVANVRLLDARLRSLGYQCTGVTSAEEALAAAMASPPDLVITDIMMPGIDGYELTRQLKANPRTRLVPVVLATALEGAAARIEGLECGADEFLTKPVNATELELSVRSLVRVGRLRSEMSRRRAVMARPAPEVDPAAAPEDRVLIVDDDIGFARQTGLSLKAAGLHTDWAQGLKEARRLLRTTRYSTILVDIFLPDGSGNELVADIRAMPTHRMVPLMVVSGFDDQETRLAALECGAEDYLVKPVPSAELVARVQTAVKRCRLVREQEARLHEALAASVTDPGTGLHNRRFLFEDLAQRMSDADVGGSGFGVLLADLDHFKAINDQLGHLVGDRLLREFAMLMRGSLRLSDLAARYGGEKFVAVLPGAGAETTVRTAERLRSLVEGHQFEAAPSRTVTVSIGATVWHRTDRRAEEILQRADEGVYAAKAAGRNSVRSRLAHIGR